MVPVRKPGRPLSSCPCPPGKPCACGGIKVAIPRKQKCHCGPESETPPAGSAESDTPASEPPSPPKSSYRVQKSGSAPRQNGGRKQSFDPVNLDRIDINSVNILPQYSPLDLPKSPPATSNGMTPRMHPAAVPGFGFVPPVGANGFGNVNGVSYRTAMGYGMPAFQPIGPPTPATPVSGPETSRPLEGGDGPFRSSKPLPLASKGVPPRKPSAPSDQSSPKTKAAASGSCCCGGSKADSPELKPVTAPTQRIAEPNGSYVPHFHPPMGMKLPHYPVPFAQPTVFTYPANYGSWSHPINQAMWAQMHHLQPNPVAYANAMSAAPNGAGNPALEISHECNCGPGCQCVGCLAHPFNQEMLQYVGGAWDYDLDTPTAEVYGRNASTSSTNNPHSASHAIAHAANSAASANANAKVNGNGNGNGNANANANVNTNTGTAATTNGNHHQTKNQVQTSEPGSPPQAPTPSDSVCSDEQALSTSDYFFVNLPLFPSGADADGSACGGNQALCPCGDDCQCDGCIVHNAKPLQQLRP